MAAVLHCIITDIENTRIKNNIKNWKFNFKFNDIRDNYLEEIKNAKDEIERLEKADPKLKELRYRVCENENIDHINIKISFGVIKYIYDLSYMLLPEQPPLYKISSPEDLKQLLVEIIKEYKELTHSLITEMLELKKEILANL